MRAIERLEKARHVVFVDSRSAVGYREGELAALATRGELDRLRARRIARRVLQQVAQHAQRLREIEMPDECRAAKIDDRAQGPVAEQSARLAHRRADQILRGVELGSRR